MEFKGEFECYCAKCQKMQKIKGGTVRDAAHGRRIIEGTCPECGATVNRYMS